MRDRMAYLLSSAGKRLRGDGGECPSCGSIRSMLVSRKYLVTTLRRCGDCRLMFRAPTDTAAESFDYYQEGYDSGFTTELPGDVELAGLLESGFARTPKDFGRWLRILRALGVRDGARVLDFGCSWGYGVWQFRQSGYEASGFELSVPRARFARERLQVPAASDARELPGDFDVVFSSHVLEHIPQLAETLDLLFARLRPGGMMVAVTPNGSQAYREKRPDSWQRSWGLKHPLLLDGEFWTSRSGGRPYIVTSELSDDAALRDWARQEGSRVGSLDGPELLAAVRS